MQGTTEQGEDEPDLDLLVADLRAARGGEFWHQFLASKEALVRDVLQVRPMLWTVLPIVTLHFELWTMKFSYMEVCP